MPPALGFANRVRSTLAELQEPWSPLTVSVGVAFFQPGMGSPEVLVPTADRALYAAKEGGGDRVVLWECEEAAEVDAAA